MQPTQVSQVRFCGEEFGVLTSVTMKKTVDQDATVCTPIEVRRRFGGTYYLHLQGRGVNTEAAKQSPTLRRRTTGLHISHAAECTLFDFYCFYVHLLQIQSCCYKGNNTTATTHRTVINFLNVGVMITQSV
jgi:hypothetical protein